MGTRFVVEIIPRGEVTAQTALLLAAALNDQRHAAHGLEGIYAIESATVIVWRVSTL